MHSIKKLLSIVLAIVSAAMLMPSAMAYTDIQESDYCYEAAVRLGDLGIISGYDDGSFHPNDTITRAEYARIIVSAMDKETDAKSTGMISSFMDVPDGLWSAPYINYVSSQNIVAGYSDGSFQPDKTISFAESLTILLRVLGYTEASVGYFWPNNYVDAANSLGISSDMSYGVNQPITRGDAVMMIDHALFADLCGEKDKTLLENNGYTILEDMIVLEYGTQNSKNEVRFSDSKTYTSKMSNAVTVGQFFDYAVLDKNGYLVAVKTDGGTSMAEQTAVYVTSVTDNTISYISNGVTGSIRLDNNYNFYLNGAKTTFSTVKSSIRAGTDITFYSHDNENFAIIGDDDDVAPVIAKRNYTDSDTNLEGITINHTGLTVYRAGKSASLSDIQINDVVYYNTKTNVMDVYNKKVTGIYYDAQPSKAYVQTVTVGGNSYTIGYEAAANSLNASAGSFQIGERVTLLLGKDDKAVFAIELSETTVDDYCVVLSTGTQLASTGANEGSSEQYADVFMSDGSTARLVTDKDYNTCIGYLARISYENGTAKLTRQSTTATGYGALDKTNRTLNGRTILKDARIIQRTAVESEEYAECEMLDLDTMTATAITSEQLLNIVSVNSFGDISLLYVTNVEATENFGVIYGTNKTADESVNGYKIYTIDGGTTYSSNFTVAGLSTGMPVKFTLSGSSLDKLEKLYQIKTAGSVQAVDESRIMVSDNIYKLSPTVLAVVVNDTSSYRIMSLDELAASKDIINVTLYSDTSASSASVIRVITVKTK